VVIDSTPIRARGISNGSLRERERERERERDRGRTKYIPFNHCAAALCSFGKQLLANTCHRHIIVEKFSKKSNGQNKDLFHVIHGTAVL
jgi:hypothetical protein